MEQCLHQEKSVALQWGEDVVYECSDCALLFTPGLLEDFNESLLYEDYYKNETGVGVGRFTSGVEFIVKAFRLFRAFKIYTLNPAGESILDIGCGRGWTLFFLKKYFGFTRTVGTQISRPAFEYARDSLSLEVYGKDLLALDLQESSFDVVTMWHVLEHVKNPEAYIEKIYQVLKPGGRFIVEVPNVGSWTRKFSGKYWMGYDIQYHLSFFSEKALSRLLKKYGFEIKKVRTFSLEYSTFISAQSILSKLTDTDNVFFAGIQGAPTPMTTMAVHAALMLLLVPWCFVINLVFYFSKRGEVLLISAYKK